MDLIVRNVRLADTPSAEPTDIGVADGRIVAIERGLAAEAETYDAGGRLACAGLIETHIHLDKSRIIDRAPAPEGREIRPMQQVAALKHRFIVEDVRVRAQRTLEECILNGATRMRTQVEVDPCYRLARFRGSAIADRRL
jgi:cytosine/creatinine deaminase